MGATESIKGCSLWGDGSALFTRTSGRSRGGGGLRADCLGRDAVQDLVGGFCNETGRGKGFFVCRLLKAGKKVSDSEILC